MNILEQILEQNIVPLVSNMAGQLDAVLGSLPLATLSPGDTIQGAVSLVVITGTLLMALLFMSVAWRRTRRQLAIVSTRLGALEERAAATDSLLAETTADLAQLRQRAGQLSQRQETAVRNGLRQAIALSRHGATARQIMDTCGLSQGEVHLIHTLYGRSHQAAASADTTSH